jgi:type I restriction enzyme R subunit
MNEADTRAELIDPQLRNAGWGIGESKITREFSICPGRIEIGGRRKNPKRADYLLSYKGIKLAVVEAKPDEDEVGEGVAQAKDYASKLNLENTFSANGKEIYHIDLFTGKEGLVDKFPAPEELFNKTLREKNEWLDKFNSVPFEKVADREVYYFQEVAANNALKAIANKKKRILLTLATGTGKTFIAFQIVWKLFHTRWNIQHDGKRQPRVLFLADRNFLANQAFNVFSAFPEDALVRIKPDTIARSGKVPTNGNIFFTIFQTFMSGKDGKPYFGEYPKDYFDLIIVDECHRGGANNESTWRKILEYFDQATQLGLTATPKRESENLDTYKYFGKPSYIYSLKEGIMDGFLTPFKLKQYSTTLDTYIYAPDDEVIEGEVEEGRLYEENEFNINIRIREREEKRVGLFLDQINQNEKTLVFCANQAHALLIRDMINQKKQSDDIDFCHRVTADDGELGENHLRNFQDNEKLIPTILTTSRKLSTGVDARNIRNIVLLRPIRTMIEFKQIIGRGTRLYEGKHFFSVHDFVKAYEHFKDPEWDGEPIEPVEGGERPVEPIEPGPEPPPRPERVEIRLADGKERRIQSMMATSYIGVDGNPVSAEKYVKELYEHLPNFFTNEDQLREIWKMPDTRKKLLKGLEEKGFGKNELREIQEITYKEDCDVYDVLAYIAYASNTKTRKERSSIAKSKIENNYNANQIDFINFLLDQYIMNGIFELDPNKLPDLVQIKYGSIIDAEEKVGDIDTIKSTFNNFQKYLYS